MQSWQSWQGWFNGMTVRCNNNTSLEFNTHCTLMRRRRLAKEYRRGQSTVAGALRCSASIACTHSHTYLQFISFLHTQTHIYARYRYISVRLYLEGTQTCNNVGTFPGQLFGIWRCLFAIACPSLRSVNNPSIQARACATESACTAKICSACCCF